MKYGRWILGGCLAVTGAMSIAFAAAWLMPNRPDKRTALHLAALEQRLAELERDPPSRTIVEPRVTKSERSASPAEESQRPGDERTVAGTRESDEVKAASLFAGLAPSEQLAAYESDFSQQPSARSAWANEKEMLLVEAWRGSPGRVRVDCRADICRVETEHTSAAEAELFLDQQAFSPGLLGTTYYRYPLDDVGKRFVLFVSPGGIRNPARID